MEVVEHLPRKIAEKLCRELTKLGSVIVFSAAIPYQGGIGHINENWPDYWVQIFEKENFVVLDLVRDKIWEDKDVEWWYAQNILIFVNKELANSFEKFKPKTLIRIHPKYFHRSPLFGIFKLLKIIFRYPSKSKEFLREYLAYIKYLIKKNY